jgi:hypothetical protein
MSSPMASFKPMTPGPEMWQFQTGQVGLGRGAGPSGAAAMTYESHNQQLIALANNRPVWAFKIGGTVSPREAPMPPAIVREWTGRVTDTAAIQLGNATTFTIAAANRTRAKCLTPSRRVTDHGRPVQSRDLGRRDDREGRHVRVRVHGASLVDRPADRRVDHRSWHHCSNKSRCRRSSR